jgi:hypothetical protein
MGLNRRKLLVGLGGITIGGGSLLGTGAFSSVEADRTVDVEVAGDSEAFLALAPTDDPNGAYAEISNGTLEVTIGEDAGVNANAITHIDKVLQVTNQGTQEVVLYFEEVGGDGNTAAVDVGALTEELVVDSVGEADQPTSNGIYDTSIVDLSDPSPPDSGAGYGDIGVLLGVGTTIKLGFYVDTSDDNLNDGLNESSDSDIGAGELLMEELVIYADANAADNGDYQFTATSN